MIINDFSSRWASTISETCRVLANEIKYAFYAIIVSEYVHFPIILN